MTNLVRFWMSHRQELATLLGEHVFLVAVSTAIAVAIGLGWAIDHWLGTRPWGMIVLFFLGIAAGMLNVYRAVNRIGGAAGYRKPGGTVAGTNKWDDEDC